ncbi:uncharacterized protein LOC114420585 [Glycine soja]|uniref:uncharacterized protein LOC114420585 n=1 Tax=Glycine soja TaxID=3848 RepID=UPI00103F4A90|nr:uncharacterized protein LOC114420585 [Glycine soja]
MVSYEHPTTKRKKMKQLDLLEERLRAVEGFGDYPFADMTDLCLVPDVVIPPKFKVPDFDKYKGTTCPKNHLKMYCRKMGAHSKDEKLLIHFFQDSLAGAAVVWYTNLEASRIRTWKDLITAFLRQYQYNSDMAPDRTQLQNMFKKEGETFKEYAQRWRDLAAQVAPPMVEREMITMMVDTLPVFYYEKLVGYMPSSFADLVFAGERIEVGLKRLRIIQQSEFKVIEQLNKTPARVSLLELLMSSEPHRALLVKVLNEAHVAQDISVEGFGGLVNNITANNYLAFAEEEIPAEGRGHNKALHVSVKCMDHIVAKVLIDNGSSLNVMPKSTLEKLPFNVSHLKPSSMVVRAFDGTRREVRGEIDLPVQIGPHTCQVTFQIMDINPPYSCLLGRPWIHSVGVVPSTLHQKLKFVVEGHLVIVSGEEDILVSCPSSMPYEQEMNQTEDEGDEDVGLPSELERMVTYEDQEMGPHQEETELVDLGFGSGKREVKIGTGITAPIREELIILLKDYQDIFAWSYQDMPGLSSDIVQHRLPLNPGCSPVKQKLRRMKPETSLKIKEEVKKQFDAGFLAVARYPEWVANIVPVPKKDGKVRMCVDYRDLNRASPKDNFPLPHIDILVDNTANFALCSFMDGFSGYNQIKMAPEDMEKTTFVTLWGTFCYKVMSFGLKNAGATYQRAMVALFHDMMHQEIEVYVDDIIAKSKSEEEHLVNLRKLFERLKKYQLRLNPAKCTFGVKSGKLLGFIVSQKGIEVDPEKVKAILEMPEPRTERQVRGFLGRLNYIARFISQLTAICEPLFKLLRKNQTDRWNEDCQEAFGRIKKCLMNPPVLMPPVPGRPLILYMTILDESMGCMLGQHDESGKKERAVYYLSKKFTTCEMNYSLLERTCCALVWASHRLRQYMLSHTTWLISKMDPVKYIFEKPALTGRIARWQVLLSEFDIVYVTQKAIKGSALADYLAQQPLNDYQPMHPEFPDEDIMALFEEKLDEDRDKWTVWFDGASNILGHGVGAVLISPDNQCVPFTARLGFDCTNNMAEYEACALAVQAAIDSDVKLLKVYGDSALVIHQLRGEWETRDPKLIPYKAYIKELAKTFDEISFHHVPREENQMADALATLASMFQLTPHGDLPYIEFQCRGKPAHCCQVEEERDGKPWYYDIKQYVVSKEYPPEIADNDKRTLRRLAASFFMSGGTLYKRNHDMTLLRCVDAKEANHMIEEVHEGSFGTHANGHAMARKILRAGYYWLTMESDCCVHVRKCHKCQAFADNVNAPPHPLNVMSAPWPFSMWGIDVIGAIEPKASNGHRFILVAIDYFTKWVEAASYTNVTRNVVVRFIKKEIICRYGLPRKIITDNGTNLNNKMMGEMCEEFKIQHHNSTPYRPKMNGAVEAANKNIKKIIQKMTVSYKDWHEMLPFALHGYRTSVRTSTGATPFSLVYGMEAVLPFEVEVPSLRILAESGLKESEWAQTRYDQLNLIEGKRLTAMSHGRLYQQRMKSAFDKKVRLRKFHEGDLMLKKMSHAVKDHRGKWAPNYEGPFVVKRAFSGGALVLTNMDGEELPSPVNSDVVKQYYA